MNKKKKSRYCLSGKKKKIKFTICLHFGSLNIHCFSRLKFRCDFFPFFGGRGLVSHPVVLAGLELCMKTKLASDSQSFACHCLLNDRTEGVHHHAQFRLDFI